MVKGPKERINLFMRKKIAMFVMKSNLQFSICDECSKIVSDVFPNSELTKKIYSTGKTKTSQIIKDKRRGILKNLNCRPTSRKKGAIKFVELILLWCTNIGIAVKFNFFKNRGSLP